MRSQKQARTQRADAQTPTSRVCFRRNSSTCGPAPGPLSGTLRGGEVGVSRRSKNPCRNVTELVAQGHAVFAKHQLLKLMLERVCCRRLNVNVVRQGALNTSCLAARRGDNEDLLGFGHRRQQKRHVTIQQKLCFDSLHPKCVFFHSEVAHLQLCQKKKKRCSAHRHILHLHCPLQLRPTDAQPGY